MNPAQTQARPVSFPFKEIILGLGRRIPKPVEKTLEVAVFSAAYALVAMAVRPQAGTILSGIDIPGLVTVLIACWYGGAYGILFLVLQAAALLFIPVPGTDFHGRLAAVTLDAGFRYPILLLAAYLAGLVRSFSVREIGTQRAFLRKAAAEKARLKEETVALKAVNLDFEERVLCSGESFSFLYSRIKALDSQEITKTLSGLLEILRQYTWARKASIWRYHPMGDVLELACQTGWGQEDFMRGAIPAGDGIEGWVWRNGTPFSARMTVRYENLKKLDTGGHIMTFRISTPSGNWGILNIEDMPFHKYDDATEKTVAVILELAGVPIGKASAMEEEMTGSDIHPLTGLPTFETFRRMLDRKIRGAGGLPGSFSVILVEIANLGDIETKAGPEAAAALAVKYLHALSALSLNVIQVFHYRDTDMFAVLHPKLDEDGASLFCLEALELASSREWEHAGRKYPLEVMTGFAAIGASDAPSEVLLKVAESHLERQRAFA